MVDNENVVAEADVYEADRYGEIYHHLSDAEYIALVSVGEISSLLSIFGSLSIIYIIARNKKKLLQQREHVLYRIMTGLSMADFVSSVAFAFQPFLLPKYTTLEFAFGNVMTCEAVGFLSIYGLASHMYNCFLSVYFLVTIRSNWSTQKTSRILEPWIHVVAWFLPTALGISEICLDMFNPRPVLGVCLPAYYPVDCNVNDDVQCSRGPNNVLVRDGFSLVVNGISVLSAVGAIASTWWMHHFVERQYRRSNRYEFRQNLSTEQKESLRASVGSATQRSAIDRDDNIMARRKSVARQAVCYTLVFANPFLLTVIGITICRSWTSSLSRLDDLKNRGIASFLVIVMIYLLYPLQGFLNWCVYIRPAMIRWKRSYPEKSWCWLYGQIVSGKSPPMPSPSPRRLCPQGQGTKLAQHDLNDVVEKVETA